MKRAAAGTPAAESIVTPVPPVVGRGISRVGQGRGAGMGGSQFNPIDETPLVSVNDSPLSTFSIDVDTAAYTKARMYLRNGSMPPPDSVRIEEFVNYFKYDYPSPTGADPFAIHVDVANAPWCDAHRLVRVGIQGRELERQRPDCNLVFLLDVSGSMNAPCKLPLVQQGLRVLVSQLTEQDRVAIVVYAGAAGLVLPSTKGNDRERILRSIDQLAAGGSTNGGQGIRLAYQVAQEHFIEEGVNRVILCTDGDFNVGTTSTGDLVRLAAERARTGVFLSVLAYGMDNHNDAMLELVSNRANGNYAFIDSEDESRKVFRRQLESTLVPIATDVKIQVEFNPAVVAEYRLIGYENRRLQDRDFKDDAKDAGDVGAGHSVTALYEIVPTGLVEGCGEVDSLKYSLPRSLSPTASCGEMMTVKLRYKHPGESRSRQMVMPVMNRHQRFAETVPDFQFASAVAAFGMLLRRSDHRGNATYDAVLEIARVACGADPNGYRGEFLELVRIAKRLDGEIGTSPDFVSWCGPKRVPDLQRPRRQTGYSVAASILPSMDPVVVHWVLPAALILAVSWGVGLGVLVATLIWLHSSRRSVGAGGPRPPLKSRE